MSRDRKRLSKILTAKGFKPPFRFYFWNNDGWYVDSEELNHQWIGQNINHVLDRLDHQSKEDVIRGQVFYNKGER